MAFRTAPPRPPKFQGKLPSSTSLAPCPPVNHTHSAPGAEAPCRTASLSQPGSGLTARANHGSLTQLLAQAPHGLWLAAHAQERALAIGALLQHRAGGEDLPAQFLRRPGKEELGLDEAPLEERDYRLAQPGDVALPLRAHHDAGGVLRAQRGLVPAAVDLVEDDEARHVLRADLAQHFLGHRDLPLEPGIARIDHVEEQRRLERFVERRLERRDQPVRQVLDEADRIADQHARDGLGVEGAHRSVERREELVGDQRLACRQRAHQGGLARIRVSDERHAGEALALPPPGALRLVLRLHRVELLLQLGDAVADLAPVELAVRLAAAAAAGAAAPPVLRTGLLGGFAHARRHVPQARDLDLRARVARARVPVEDLEDDHAAVHHLAADLLRQVELLRGGNFVVDEEHVHGLPLAHEAQLLPLAGSEVRPRLEPRALLREPADDLEPQRLRELAQLRQRRLELGVAHAGPLHARDDGALRLRVDILHHGGGAYQ